jgi:hypothetical protein
LLTGDLNILKFPLAEKYTNKLISLNQKYKEMVEKINKEYENNLLKNLKLFFGDKFSIIDTSDFLGSNICTYADFDIDYKSPELIPKETVLTH